LFDVIEGVVYVPEVVFEPVQASDAVQLVVFVDDHVSFDVPPDATDVGDADNVSVGAVLVDPVTVTEAVRVTEPPLPVHVSVKLEFVVSAFVVKVPESAVGPDHAPDAAQLVVCVEDQLSFEVPPDATDVGEAENVSVGAVLVDPVTVTETVRVTEPPVPVHSSVKLEVAVSGFVVKVPERAVRPDHAPEAAQLSAYADFQVSCDVEPDVIEVGDADNVSAGTAAEAEIGAINNRAPERTIDETSRRRNPPGFVILYAHHATNAEHPAVSMLVCKPALADEWSDYPAITDEGVAGPFVCASPQSCFYNISTEGR
jgi:hypothetical protein